MLLPAQRSRPMGWFLFLTGLISLAASFLLARDGYLLAAEGTTPSCDINPFFSCGNVMESWQARVFLDAPNQLMGIAGWAVVATIGVGLIQGAGFQKWFWRIAGLGMLGAWVFLMWLFQQAVFVIGFLCLYCMVVWVLHTILFWVFVPWAAREGLFGQARWLTKAGATLAPFSWVPIVATFATIALTIYVQFPLLFI
ncbi:vitamin K epoxide reductase family protein [Pontimonas sp.]|uniref:vitamin K epoxide reductase family protein n=1 Tax=Pontimonas sp. TaxID=2304492 RepID=UPI00286FD5C7|nr:vitamin K epoxide reductase family protein [Pontimonas sp.]MDR9395954.1 vitamin K epoxide reductase family protein [Pontimonas sp.]MDR9434069.1 vitamin K epoxide reductase family protein [Pontimonas sp.]